MAVVVAMAVVVVVMVLMVLMVVKVVKVVIVAEVMLVREERGCSLQAAVSGVRPEYSPGSLMEGPLSGDGKAGCGPQGPGSMFGVGLGSSTETRWTLGSCVP